MYDKTETSVRTKGDITSAFPITIGLHQGSTLSLYLFVLAMDELIRSFNMKSLIYAFANDIVLVDETRCGVKVKLEIWRDVLESRGLFG
jgi:hypothetical protein